MKVQALVVHHSASNWGDRDVIDAWHKSRGWSGIGYHRVILNGLRTYKAWATRAYEEALDGHIQQGRPDTQNGAHCPGMNQRSLGICLIGNFETYPPTPKQWAALVDACARLCRRYGLSHAAVHGHREYRQTACPGRRLDLERLRREVGERLTA